MDLGKTLTGVGTGGEAGRWDSTGRRPGGIGAWCVNAESGGCMWYGAAS